MQYVDLERWERKTTFEYFKDFEDPFFNLTANVDATAIYRFSKENGLSFALISLFCSLRAANGIREFRLRFDGERVAEFGAIHATHTVLNDDDTFSFCYFEYLSDPFEFDRAGKESVEEYKRLKSFDVENDRLDLIYYSVIPWVSFTSFKHAGRHDNRHSVPRLVFGKTFDDMGRIKMPHSVEVHHALVDGLHVGRYFESFQETMDAIAEI